MNLIEYMIQSGTTKNNNKIKKSCEKLFKEYNLDSFGYFKIYNNGPYYYLGSHIGWSEYFASQKLYLNYPYFRSPTLLQNGINLPGATKDSSYRAVLNTARDKFQMKHSLILLKKEREYLESFIFCSNMEDELQSIEYLLNGLPILSLFAQYFCKEHGPLHSFMEDNKVNLASLMGPLFHQPSSPAEKKPLNKNAFLQEMHILPTQRLSPNDIEVLKNVLMGYSAGEIAKQIHRSPRTVEHRIEKIKDKLDVSSRAGLIQKARQLDSIEYFS